MMNFFPVPTRVRSVLSATLICAAASLLLATSELSANEEVEFGLLYSVGARTTDRFDRGLRKFRTTVRRDVYSISETSGFNRVDTAEIFFRFGGLISPNSYFGMAVGQYQIPLLRFQEVRSDEVFVSVRSRFELNYFLFQYHYKQYWRRGWSWEAGMGAGFIPIGYWRTEGRRISALDTLQTLESTEFNAFQTARFGAISRLELGLHRMLGDHGFFRTGVRASYGFVGPFFGTVNDVTGNWYFLDDGSLALLSAFEAASSLRNFDHPINGSTTVDIIREKANVTLGLTELQFSVGVRF